MKNSKFIKVLVSMLFIITFVSSMLLIFLLVKNNILPNKYKIPFLVVVGIINILILIQIIREKFLSTFIMLILFTTLFVFSDYYIMKGMDTLNIMKANSMHSTTNMSIVVLKDSDINSVNELVGKKVIAPLELDKKNIDEYNDKIKKDGIRLDIENASSYEKAAISLLENQTDAMFLNQAYIENISHVVKGFKDKIKYIDEIEVTRKEDTKSVDVETSQESFNVYISGVDNYGSIQNSSRSDVNIIVTVNPLTKKILITSIPRDSYVEVPIDGDYRLDKLTHAGVYGVDKSIQSLERLLDMEVNYFSRVNFTSFVNIVDTIGGIELENPRAFDTYDNSYYFEEGPLTLDGDKALSFSRERQNLPGGDNDRGKNQELVLQAIINKLMSPTILSNYSEILDTISPSVQTNMGSEKIIELVNMQLSDNAKWDIYLQTASGTGDSASCYAAGGEVLYVTRLSDESVDHNKENIKNIYEGRDFVKYEE